MTTTLETLQPKTLREAHAAMRETARDAKRVVFCGGETAFDWGGAPDADIAIKTTQLDGVIAYNPADMTIAVGAGMPLSKLQDLASQHGQWLAVDAAREASGATIGGLMATGDAGPRTLSYGTMRDLVIGATVILADGAVARSGGHVIKNVAGYDLAKLFWGSLGTLGLIAEVVLRLHPRPRASESIVIPCGAQRAFELSCHLTMSQLEPAALEWDGTSLHVVFEGTPEGVDARHAAALEMTGGRALSPSEEQLTWRALRGAVLGVDGDTVLRCGTKPDALPTLVSTLDQCSTRRGISARLTSSVASGIHTICLSGGDAEGHAACVVALREQIEELNGTSMIRRRNPEVDALISPWGKAPSAVAVMRNVKRVFDPAGRCAPGRFQPWF